jgi:hypothetical protein
MVRRSAKGSTRDREKVSIVMKEMEMEMTEEGMRTRRDGES